MHMKSLIVLALVTACGNPKSGDSTTPTGSATEPPPPMQDTRTAFEKRLDTACDALGPTLTACAVADTDAKLASGEITKAEHDALTKPEIRAALDKDWRTKCYQPTKRSSRQIRVLEVCKQQETECGPLQDCLDNLNKQ